MARLAAGLACFAAGWAVALSEGLANGLSCTLSPGFPFATALVLAFAAAFFIVFRSPPPDGIRELYQSGDQDALQIL